MTFSLFFAAAVILDLLFGDPRWLPHPIRGIGWLCTCSEQIFRKLLTDKLLLAGLCTIFSVLSVTAGITAVLLLFCHHIGFWAESICAILLFYSAIAIRDLLDHSNRVYVALQRGDIADARQKVQMIVGRDTESLDEAGIVRACVETVAENMADGIIAPIFWGVTAAMLYDISPVMREIFGLQSISIAAIAALLYKACNTMDSMFGYKNKEYIDFGRYPALLDDTVNYIPARLAGIFIIVASALLGLKTINGIRVFWRDRYNHSSPNAGYPESAMAGALEIMLGGASCYFGEIVEKPTIGDGQQPIGRRHIVQANRLVLVGSLCCVVVLGAIQHI